MQGSRCILGRCLAERACALPDGGLFGGLPPLGVVAASTLVFEDAFEGPGLFEGAGGRWSRHVHSTVQGQTLSLTRDAGRAGGALTLVDVSTTNAGAQNGQFAAKDFQETSGDLFIRAQVWLSDNGVTGPHVIAVYATQLPSSVAAEFNLRGDVAVKGDTRGGGQAFRVLPSPWVPQTWRQVDLVLTGLGSSRGVASLSVGGESVALDRDWTDARLTAVGVGASSMESGWVGTLKVDNLAVTLGGPAPGRLVLVPSSPLVAGRCAPARVELHDTFDGGLAKAVRPVRVALSGGPFLPAGCDGGALLEITVPTGAAATEFAVSISNAAMSVSAEDLGGDLQATSDLWTPVP